MADQYFTTRQIQKGLLQVGKGLQFLNHDAKVVHRNLVPEAIFVNAKVCVTIQIVEKRDCRQAHH
jgi:serine/threonine protein kinase